MWTFFHFVLLHPWTMYTYWMYPNRRGIICFCLIILGQGKDFIFGQSLVKVSQSSAFTFTYILLYSIPFEVRMQSQVVFQKTSIREMQTGIQAFRRFQICICYLFHSKSIFNHSGGESISDLKRYKVTYLIQVCSLFFQVNDITYLY